MTLLGLICHCKLLGRPRAKLIINQRIMLRMLRAKSKGSSNYICLR